MFVERGYGQAFTSIQKITAEERQKHGNFGISVDVSEEYAIVGSHTSGYDSLNKPNASGLAFIFKVDSNGTWHQEQELIGSDAQFGENFGRHVAISGTYAVISTRRQSTDANGENKLPYSGAAYVFEKGDNGVWKQVQKLVAFDREEKAFFGHSVDIGGDFIVVGAHHEPKNALGEGGTEEAGAVYVYKRDSSGYWQSYQKLVASDRKQLSNFGISVQIWDKTIAIGANRETSNHENKGSVSRAGAVYIFKQQSAGMWKQTQKITPADRLKDDWFGSDVSLYKNNLIIGAYLKDLPGRGGINIRRAGAAYIYQKDIDGEWKFVTQLTAPNTQVNDHFGWDVSIAENVAYVAMWHDHELPEGRKELTQDGLVYAYIADSCGNWHLSHEIYPPEAGHRDGFAVSIASNEDFLWIGNFRGDHDIEDQQEMMDAGSAFVLSRLPMIEKCETPEIIEVFAKPGGTETTSTSVDETIERPLILIDPNPNRGIFNVNVLNYKEGLFSLEVQNPFGKTILRQAILEQNTTVELHKKARGPFVVIVSSSAGIEKRIVIVKKRKRK